MKQPTVGQMALFGSTVPAAYVGKDMDMRDMWEHAIWKLIDEQGAWGAPISLIVSTLRIRGFDKKQVTKKNVNIILTDLLAAHRVVENRYGNFCRPT